MKTKPKYWKSLLTGKEYPYEEYANHGYGGEKCFLFQGRGMICFEDLPKDEYPYTIVYEEPVLPSWMQT